jgi:hypothetical protein
MSNKKSFANTQNLACALNKKKPFQTKDNSSHVSFKKRKHAKGKRTNVPQKRNKDFQRLKPDLDHESMDQMFW